MRLLSLAGFTLLASLSAALHFPGLVSKDYAYDDTLPIRQSFYLTTGGKSEIAKEFAKNTLGLQKVNFAPRFPINESFDMCHPHFGMGEDAAPSAQSPIAGYFGTGSKVVNSAYDVPMKHGIPLKIEGKK